MVGILDRKTSSQCNGQSNGLRPSLSLCTDLFPKCLHYIPRMASGCWAILGLPAVLVLLIIPGGQLSSAGSDSLSRNLELESRGLQLYYVNLKAEGQPCLAND